MPLQLLCPPVLVTVRDLGGVLRPALLLGRRDDRAYLQVRRGPGDNVLRWLPSSAVGPAGGAPDARGATDRPGREAPLSLRAPRSWR